MWRYRVSHAKRLGRLNIFLHVQMFALRIVDGPPIVDGGKRREHWNLVALQNEFQVHVTWPKIDSWDLT